MFDIIKANLIKRKTMKKIVLAAVVVGLCSLNLAGADEDIANSVHGRLTSLKIAGHPLFSDD